MSHRPDYQRTRFLDSVAQAARLPHDRGIEIAFAGRSNAGKSSALNALTGRRSLARTSKTPGRTRLINLFALDDDIRLADLPGYGHAAVSNATRERWTRLLGEYLQHRRSLRGLVLIVDIRRGLTALDWQLLELIAERPVALHVLLTKADKLGRGAARRTLGRVRQELEAAGLEATLQCFSATHREGIEDLRNLLDEWLSAGDPRV